MKKRYYKREKLRDIKALVRRAGTLYPDKIAYREIGPQNQIAEYSFSRLEQDVNAFGTKLLDMGMKGYHIAILGENSYAWVVSFLSVVNGVGVAVPLDKELMDKDLVKLLHKSDTDVIICSDSFVQTVKNILPECPRIKACIVMNPVEEYPGFFVMEKLIREGRELLEQGRRDYVDCFIDREEMCEIVFTSGTMGVSKGVMLSHKNIMAVVYGALSLVDPGGVSFSVLPVSHTYECNCHILPGLYCGVTICFNDSLKRVVDNINLFKPNITLMVPLFLKAIHRSIWQHAEKNGLEGHLRFGIKLSNLLRKIGIDLRRIYFKPILDRFGGNLCQIICGGAPLNPDIAKGLEDVGIEVMNGYGITECAPLVAVNTPLWKKAGSVGQVIPVCRVKIDNPDIEGCGEILVKGDNVMLGYYKDPEGTKASFTEDGWFRTGDLGYLDKRNFLYITGRKKNLIVLSNGKNVQPEEIEELILAKLPYVKEVVVFAPGSPEDDQEYIAAYVYVDEEFLNTREITDYKGRLNEDIKILNRGLPSYKRIAKVLISETEFEKITTRKIKRKPVIERGIENA